MTKREKYLERRRLWRAANREKIKAQNRRYRSERVDEERERAREYRRRNQEAVRRRARNAMFRRKYGITLDERDALIAAQGGRCGICENTFGAERRRWPCIDHDHTTGRIRGVLCHACNIGIGKLGDTAEALRRALRYLEK
jgi:hypothetical protein